jgi:glycosyltransferase involved in cell wall biosynthesis
MQVMAPSGPRVRVLGALISRAKTRVMVVVTSKEKVHQAERVFGGRRGPIYLAEEQTDTEFFRPAAERDERSRPLIVSCGLEQRDCVTLAGAIEGLDVDSKICAASPNYADKTRVAIPDVLPDNVEMRLFDFSELRVLYQQADITVLTVLPNDYAAGSTSLLEAVACGSPVIMTQGVGTPQEFIDDGLIVGVPATDVDGLRNAIVEVLADREAASGRSERARERVLSAHSKHGYIEGLNTALVAFQSGS